MENNQTRCALADAIVIALWVKDLITTEEKDEIMRKNKLAFVSK